MEREAKFPVPDPGVWQSIAQADRVAGLDQVPLGREHQRNTYYDTEDRAFSRAGFACRVREVGERTLLTVKGPAHTRHDVIHRFEEERAIERSLPEDRAGFVAVAVELLPAEARASVGAAGPLFPILLTETDRRTFALEREGRRVCELTLDEVDYRVEVREVPVYREMELEAKSATEGEMARIVRWFREEWGLQPTSRSKLEVGLEILGRRGRTPQGG